MNEEKMSEDKKSKVTIFTEGKQKTNGSNQKPTTTKPQVQPSGQQSTTEKTTQKESK